MLSVSDVGDPSERDRLQVAHSQVHRFPSHYGSKVVYMVLDPKTAEGLAAWQDVVAEKGEGREKIKQLLRTRRPTLREFLGEFIGTFLLVAIGCGSVAQVVLSRSQNGDFMTINLAFALAATFAIYVCGGVTGGHINPAITLTTCLLKMLPWRKLPVYWAGQYLGAFVGAVVVYCIYHNAIYNFADGQLLVDGANATAGIFATYPQPFLTAGNAFADQVFGTAILSGVVIALLDPKNVEVPKYFLPILIGLTIGVVGMAFGFNCGYAINPARDLGPRVLTAVAGWGLDVFSVNNYNWFWIPIVAPHIGAICGAVGYYVFIGLHWPKNDKDNDDVFKDIPV